LLPAGITRNAVRSGAIDVGTTIGPSYRVVEVLASEHRFNTSAFDTWRTAFRECVKLSAHLTGNTDKALVAARLDVWCADVAADPAYADQCVAGARAGRAYGERYAGQLDALSRINDFAWLRDVWDRVGSGCQSAVASVEAFR
jgi:hypothetical protein